MAKPCPLLGLSLPICQKTGFGSNVSTVLSFYLPLISLPRSQSPVFSVETSSLLEMRSWRGEKEMAPVEGWGYGPVTVWQSLFGVAGELSHVAFVQELSCVNA